MFAGLLTSCFSPLCPPPSPPACLPALPCPLQVSSLQVYDELLESALKAVGCGPRNLALHGPWVWLLDRFCDSYAVGRNYARLSYLKWVVRPENATLTADCFDVLLRDMVALQQAAAVDGLSSGELGVQAQVGGQGGRMGGWVSLPSAGCRWAAAYGGRHPSVARTQAPAPNHLIPRHYGCCLLRCRCLPASTSSCTLPLRTTSCSARRPPAA